MADRFEQIRELMKQYNKRFNLNNFDMLKMYNEIFKRASTMSCVEVLDSYVHVVSTQKLLDNYFPKLRKIRSANFLQLKKYEAMGFLEIQQRE
jgi:hypothetical protein